MLRIIFRSLAFDFGHNNLVFVCSELEFHSRRRRLHSVFQQTNQPVIQPTNPDSAQARSMVINIEYDGTKCVIVTGAAEPTARPWPGI